MRASPPSKRMSTPHPEALSSSSPNSTPAHDQSAYQTRSDTSFLTRTVRQQDLLALADLLASSFHGQEGWMRWVYPLLKAGIYEDLKSRFHSRSSHYACLVAVKPTLKGQVFSELSGRVAPTGLVLGRDTLVGTVELSLKTPSLLQPWNTKYLYLSNLAVKSDYRRQGIAQQLLQTCEKIALDWGFSDLYLHVLENNHQARRLYWKAGYRVQRIEVNPVTLLLGQPRQLFLRKRLQELGGSACS